eukprot:PhF_6_TR14034/c0_g1_i1/m.22462
MEEEMMKMAATNEMSVELKRAVSSSSTTPVAFHRVIVVYGVCPEDPPSLQDPIEGECHFLHIPGQIVETNPLWTCESDWASVSIPEMPSEDEIITRRKYYFNSSQLRYDFVLDQLP